MPKLRVTPSERHSQPIACLDGSVVPAGVPDFDIQELAHSGARSVARRIAYGAVKEIDKSLAQCAHWLGAIAKGDLDPCDEATAKAAGVPASRIKDPSKPKKKAD
jgi:hypothetical protein